MTPGQPHHGLTVFKSAVASPFCGSTQTVGNAGAPVRVRRILAYGDSLTAGFEQGGRQFSPYGNFLVPCLDAVEVVSCGLSGLTALQLAKEMEAESIRDCAGRVGSGIQRTLTEKGPFDLALIMIGTNDLSNSAMPLDGILARVQTLHASCHRKGVPTFVLSVPSRLDVLKHPEFALRWQHFNSVLHMWAKGAGAAEGVAQYVDINELVPFMEGSKLWDADGLHFSTQGSKQLAARLAPIIAGHLSSRSTTNGHLQIPVGIVAPSSSRMPKLNKGVHTMPLVSNLNTKVKLLGLSSRHHDKNSADANRYQSGGMTKVLKGSTARPSMFNDARIGTVRHHLPPITCM